MKTRIPPPLVTLAFAMMMLGLDRQFPAGRFDLPEGGTAALLLSLLGLAIIAAAGRNFRKAGTTVNPLDPARASSLVSAGIFRRSRNPMYLSMLVFLIALGIWLGNVSSIVALTLFVWFMTRFQIKPEEEALTQLFGAEYEDYCSRVRRWI